MDIVLRAEFLSKIYRLYAQPQDRLKEMLFGRLGRRYSRDFWALRDVSFELGRGQRLGVIGRNGSGKSTLLQILAGTLSPSSGQIEIAGRVAALLELGSGFNPDFTGRENIYMNASILGLTQREIEQRFDAIAAFADIGQFLDQPVKTYSSGMFVRLAFAVVTSVDADVLLVDEALAVGDVFFTQKCYRHLNNLVDRGVSVVFVSHDMNSINQFCTSVLVLERGKVEFLGDPVVGIRKYFALQRGESAVSTGEVGARDFNLKKHSIESQIDWPAQDALLPLDSAVLIGSGARCTAVALCDEQGEACRQFQMGDTARFLFEFALEDDIDVPIGGLEIFNERDLIVHGKNSLQYELLTTRRIVRGSRVRFERWVVLNIAPGTYTFALGLSTGTHETIAHAAEMPYTALAGRLRTLLVVNRVGAFGVTMRRTGQALSHHGLCDLAGDMRCQVLEPSEDTAEKKTEFSASRS